MGWYEGDIWRWTLTQGRALNLDEGEKVENLKQIPTQVYPIRNVKDKVLWDKKEKFKSKDLVNKVNRVMAQGVLVDCLVSLVWGRLTPPKAEFFM